MEQPFLPVLATRPHRYLVFTGLDNQGRIFLCVNTGQDAKGINICNRYRVNLPDSSIKPDRGFAPFYTIEELVWWSAHPDQLDLVCKNQPVQPVPANQPTEIETLDAWILPLLRNLEEYYGNNWTKNHGCFT